MTKSNITKKSILELCFDYFQIVLPVGIYVALESIHRMNFGFLFTSPEWAIVTIFLSFQTPMLYEQNLKKTERIISRPFMNLLWLVCLLIIICSAIIAFQALIKDSSILIFCRMMIFLVTSAAFLGFVGAAKNARISHEEGNNGK